MRRLSPALTLLALVALFAAPATAARPEPVKIAFIGDQGLGPDPEAVLRLIRDEGAHAVVHSGDFDYENDPAAWDDQINRILGADFPYFASVGNHDDELVSGTDESGAYQQVMVARMNRLGIPWEGVLGVQSSLYFEGIFILLTAPGLFGDGDDVHAPYIRDRLAADDSIWRISSWHYNMREMQVGGKGDAAGWGVYEESRAGGAIIATGHEHSYSRTHLLASCERQEVASTDDTLVLAADDLATPDLDEGRSFVFVSGLGGKSVRTQERSGDWWASIYTADQGATHGALFGEFNHGRNARLAHFYFKDIAGNVPDEFYVESTLGREPEPPAKPLRKCIEAQGKSFTRVTKAQGKEIRTCLKEKARGTLADPLAECFRRDARGKVAKAMAKTERSEARACTEPLPGFGSGDAATVNEVARQAGIDIAGDALGPDLDAATGSRCQQVTMQTVDKCHLATVIAYQKCKRAGLRKGTIRYDRDLAACLEEPPDRKVEKACGQRISGALDKRCVAEGIGLSDALPGCESGDAAAVATCLRDAVSNRSCLALTEADGLDPALCGDGV